MTRGKKVRLFVLLLAVGVFGVLQTYWSSVRRARTPVIIVERDRSDIRGVPGPQAPGSYEPYFTLANSIPGAVTSETNVVHVMNAPK